MTFTQNTTEGFWYKYKESWTEWSLERLMVSVTKANIALIWGLILPIFQEFGTQTDEAMLEIAANMIMA